MRKEAALLYELNRRALSFRNSKQYFIGDRIVNYENLIKSGHFLKFLQSVAEDAFRVLYKKKKNPNVDQIDFNKEYQGERIAVYTAVYGKYDTIVDPLYIDPRCDYYIFTDQEISSNSIWKKIDMNFPPEVNTPLLKNRYVKIMAHRVLPQYRYNLYIDGNLIIVSEVSLYFSNFKCKSGIGMHLHPSNTSIYEEVMYNQRLHKITKEEAIQIRKVYEESKMPVDFGMTECNVIMRDSKNENCIRIMEEWWNRLLHGVKRDQLYFTLVLYLMGYSIDDLFVIGNNINANPMFIRESHK